jgi:hypothetical protein
VDQATITSSYATVSTPQYIVVEYLYAMGSDSTSFFSIDLPALLLTETSLIQPIRALLTGKAYVIDLCSFNISCDSPDFNVKVLTKEELSEVNTIHEVLEYTSLNKTASDILDRFIIGNEDTPIQNKLYVEIISNEGTVGNVLIQLVYIVIEDRVV